ncbi:MAG: hypothetical protein A2840_00340 [Candidatus Buchananbacteria bacterium RIFCSPHIGHO2_01_FULL_47_11b]|uniref:YbaK/aminoacyl-tRNA synthetase-associated domain-containing protein n=1 Tax=Candidatus Buchananbacteria bacterium RIFCSPHIGHO2_01_FULL_47_11b TaxID=1797537 RepID=A0A1G1Y471_9BACT|nr:MAG: hypothetical protein A2840_00340 [Candidatus Buchananbacteria bacterium RIFCSPHIGHO2_01_FULL_47_11b]
MTEAPLKVEAILKNAGVEYELFKFSKPVFTVAESQAETGLRSEQILKSMLLVDRLNNFTLFCLPGDKKIDSKKAKAAAGFVNSPRFATPQEVQKVLNQQVGAVTALLSAGKVPIIFDAGIKAQSKVSLSAGVHYFEVILKTKDLITLLEPRFVSIVQ